MSAANLGEVGSEPVLEVRGQLTAERLGTTLGADPMLLLGGLALVASAFVVAVIVVARWMQARGVTWRAALFRRVVLQHPEVSQHAESARPRGWARLRRLVRFEYELLHLGLGLAFLVGVALFLALAFMVVDQGAVAAFDLSLGRAIHRSAPPGLVGVMRFVTSLGGGEAVTVVAIVVAAALLFARRWHLAIGWCVAEAGAGLFNSLLKSLYRRARPSFEDPFSVASGWSFPSGHSMATFVTAGMLAYVVSRFCAPGWRRFSAVFLASVWTLVIGFSRICLGVHWASDVLGGFAAGAAWLAVCVSAVEVAAPSRRGA